MIKSKTCYCFDLFIGSKSPRSLRRCRSPSSGNKSRKKLAKSPSRKLTPAFLRSNTHDAVQGSGKLFASSSSTSSRGPVHPRYAKRSRSCAPFQHHELEKTTPRPRSDTTGIRKSPPSNPTSPANCGASGKFSGKSSSATQNKKDGGSGSGGISVPLRSSTAPRSPTRYSHQRSITSETDTETDTGTGTGNPLSPHTVPVSPPKTPASKTKVVNYYRSVSIRERKSPAPVSIDVAMDPSRFSNSTTRIVAPVSPVQTRMASRSVPGIDRSGTRTV